MQVKKNGKLYLNWRQSLMSIFFCFPFHSLIFPLKKKIFILNSQSVNECGWMLVGTTCPLFCDGIGLGRLLHDPVNKYLLMFHDS